MRVIAGSAKGTKLFAPDHSGLRPTTDRAKQVLFDTLLPIIALPDFIVDLFAGTGALGIEALSRGAKQAVFVEKSTKTLNYLNRNLDKTHLRSKATVFCSDAFVFLKQERMQTIELAFADPPYGTADAPKLLSLFAKNDAFVAGAILVLEESSRFVPQPDDEIELLTEKRVGDTKLFFMHKRKIA